MDRYKKNNQERKKCRLLSEELSGELHKIYSQGKGGYIPPIKFIDFNLRDNSSSFFPNNIYYFWNYSSWLRFNKKDIQEKSNILGNGTLVIHDNDYLDIRPGYYIPNYIVSFEETNNFCKQKAQESTQTRTSALQAINQALQAATMDLTELEMDDAEYTRLRSECLCYGKTSPKKEAKYHIKHINKCLWRPDRINEFKVQLLDLIQSKKNQLDQKKKQAWQEIKTQAQAQNLKETDYNPYQTQIYQQTNSEDLATKKQQILKEITDLANSHSEQEKKDKQRKFQEQAEKEQKEKEEKIRKEKEQQEQKEKERKRQAEVQAQQQETEFKKHLEQEREKAQNGQKGEKDNQQDQTDNFFPSSTDIQNNYNSDQAKTELENNNSQLTTPEQKEQAQELLKLIIAAELLVKEQKFNQKFLSKLVKEQQENTSLYQLLNKEERMDKVIKQLQSIQQAKWNSNSVGNNNKNKKPIPGEIIILGSILVIVGLGAMFLIRNKKQKRN